MVFNRKSKKAFCLRPETGNAVCRHRFCSVSYWRLGQHSSVRKDTETGKTLIFQDEMIICIENTKESMEKY